MKTQQTKDMEQALIRDTLRKGKHPALEVPYIHTIDIGLELNIMRILMIES